MHRFTILNEQMRNIRDNSGGLTPPQWHFRQNLLCLMAWARYYAVRQLVWNHNYNVKPREISSAQEALIYTCADIFKSLSCGDDLSVECREVLRLFFRQIGRGGQGNQGQRIRDEILVLQRETDTKGGMMEEWHQKIHNNTSADDIGICLALLAYAQDLDINKYWATLQQHGIDRNRLASYDRAICSEPHFRKDQQRGLIDGLTRYLRTLKAVHAGADMEAAATRMLGYDAGECLGKVTKQDPSRWLQLVPDLEIRLHHLLALHREMSGVSQRRPDDAAGRPDSEGMVAVTQRLDYMVAATALREYLGWTLHEPSELKYQQQYRVIVEDKQRMAATDRGVKRGAGGARKQTDVAAVWSQGNVDYEGSRLRSSLGQVKHALNDSTLLLDILFLDMALEDEIRTAGEGCASFTSMNHGHNLSPAAMQERLKVAVAVSEWLIVNTALTMKSLHTDASKAHKADELQTLGHCLGGWRALYRDQPAGLQGGLRLRGICERLELWMQDEGHRLTSLLQPSGQVVGDALQCDRHVVGTYAEELLRGSLLAAISGSIERIVQGGRRVFGFSPWELISAVKDGVTGDVRECNNLADVQFERYEHATILIAWRMTGGEEIPIGCASLITPSSVDILSHSAVRSRNAGVLLASCSDESTLRRLVDDIKGKRQHHESVHASWSDSDGGQIIFHPCAGQPAHKSDNTNNAALFAGLTRRDLQKPRVPKLPLGCTPHFPPLGEALAAHLLPLNAQFSKHELLGAKARNLHTLASTVGTRLPTPASVSLPLGVCEEVAMTDSANRKAWDEVRRLEPIVIEKLHNGDNCSDELKTLRKLTLSLSVPSAAQLCKSILSHLNVQPVSDTRALGNHLWKAIKEVWASKYNDRAVIGCYRAGIDPMGVRLAVLIQPIVPAVVAFVLHTRHPGMEHDAHDWVYGEAVQGLGEALVSNEPGRALGFAVRKSNPREVKVTSWWSKRKALRVQKHNVGGQDAPTFICRSDSTAEDLEGHAGAGLYDSIIAPEGGVSWDMVDLTKEPFRDPQRSPGPLVGHAALPMTLDELAGKLCDVAKTVEESCHGRPQDVEGVVTETGEVVIVQTRPQVGI